MFWFLGGVDKWGPLSLTNGFAGTEEESLTSGVQTACRILYHLHVYLISISAGCSGWTRTPSWNLSVKVSLRSPLLLFLIKLISASAMGARLTAARDRWSTYSSLQAVILQNCSEMWATWVITTTPGFRDVARFSAIINQAVPQVHFFSFFFSFPVASEPFVLCCSS